MSTATDIVWLASYPKAGNTWIRLLLMHLLNPAAEAWTPDQPIGTGNGNPIQRRQLEELCLIDVSLLSPEECDLLRPRLYAAMIQESPGRLMFKTHDAYRSNRDGQPVLRVDVPQRALYLVRDPRDVAVSLAAFWNMSIERTVAFMNDADASLAGSPRSSNKQLYQGLLDWSGHARSWLDQDRLPVLLVRYEDLRTAPVASLARVVDFLGIAATRSQLERAVRLTSFEQLQRAERRCGFCEHQQRSWPFFRRAQPGEWRDALSETALAAIEEAHAPTMQRLGYACEDRSQPLDVSIAPCLQREGVA